MGDYTTSLAKAARDVLESGEQLLAGVRGMSAGSTAQIVGGVAGAALGGAVGMVIADKATAKGRASGKEAEAGAGIAALPPQLALGLTDRRLLIFKRGGLSGKAKELVGFVPRESIASIEGEDSGSKLKPDQLRVRLVDGSEVTFEIVKNDGFSHLVDAFAK